MAEIIEELKKLIEFQSVVIEAQAKEIAELKKRVQLLLDLIKDLENRLKADSHNSSKPPSTDGYKKKPAYYR